MERLKKEAFLNLSEDEKRSLLSGWNESYEAEAVIEYLTYVGVHNLDVHFLGELARAYNNDSEEERAMEILDSVSESQRDAQWYYRYAYSYLYRNFPIDEQDKSNALFLLEKAVKLSKDDKMKDRSVELVNFCELGSVLEIEKERLPLLHEHWIYVRSIRRRN